MLESNETHAIIRERLLRRRRVIASVYARRNVYLAKLNRHVKRNEFAGATITLAICSNNEKGGKNPAIPFWFLQQKLSSR